MIATTTKRPTMATLKAFVRKNQGHLCFRSRSSFDGMTDCCQPSNDSLVRAAQVPEMRRFADGTESAGHPSHDLGIQGVWLVGQSRDSITVADVPGYIGYHVYNSCGSFDILIPAEA